MLHTLLTRFEIKPDNLVSARLSSNDRAEWDVPYWHEFLEHVRGRVIRSSYHMGESMLRVPKWHTDRAPQEALIWIYAWPNGTIIQKPPCVLPGGVVVCMSQDVVHKSPEPAGPRLFMRAITLGD